MAESDEKIQEEGEVKEGQSQVAPLEASETIAAEGVVQDEQGEEEKFQCTIQVSESGPWKKKISIEVPRKEIDKELDSQYGELRWKAEVPGFRKGRAPRRLIEKRFGKDMSEQTKLRLMAQAFEQIEEEHDFEVLGEVDFDPEKLELPDEGDFNWEYEVEVKPEFEMPNLEGVKIEKPLFEVTTERVDEALEELQKRNGHQEEITEGPAQDDDLVRAAVVMKVEGVDEEERDENDMIRVGPAVVMGVYIEDMAATLKGARIGELKKCQAEITDTHVKEEYRGKKADFSLEVKGITRLIAAELNEDFFLKIGVSDESELRQRIEEGLEQQAENEIRRMMAQQVYKYLDEKVKFELPTGVAARHADRFLARRYYELLKRGMAREMIDENLEKLQASSSEEANQQLKMSFIMETVADKLEIEVSEAELNGVVAQIAAQYGRRPERLREELAREGRLETLQNQIRDERAVDKILEMAEVVDAPVKAPEAEPEAAPEEKPKKRKTRVRNRAKDDKMVDEEAAKEKKSTEKANKAENKKVKKKTTKKSDRKEVKRRPPSWTSGSITFQAMSFLSYVRSNVFVPISLALHKTHVESPVGR